MKETRQKKPNEKNDFCVDDDENPDDSRHSQKISPNHPEDDDDGYLVGQHLG